MHMTRAANAGTPTTATRSATNDHLATPGTTLSPLRQTRRRLRSYFGVAMVFTFALNLIALVSPIYMMQVYDRVLSSGSYETLTLLTGIALFLIALFVAAEGGRRRTLAKAGRLLGACLDKATLRAGLNAAEISSADVQARVADLSRTQAFLTNGLASPLLDAPFAPLFLVVLFLIHPILGLIGLAGAAVLLGIAITTERLSREATEEAADRERAVQQALAHTVRQRGAILSMGMSEHAVASWRAGRVAALDDTLETTNVTSFLSATARATRQGLQVLILGGGAYLALQQQVSAGAIIAGSIIMGRALAPIDQAVGNWRHVVKARMAWRDLVGFLGERDSAFAAPSGMALPRPQARLSLDEAVVSVPGRPEPLLRPISLDLPIGALAVLIGPSGSGKSSLLSTVTCAWPLVAGKVSLGGRALHDWPEWDRGNHVGFLPQHVELLNGTVRQNITRFTDAPDEAVVEAAQQVGAHDAILALPLAYDTPLGHGGVHLSAGQRQAVGLARAFFRQPALIVLDEPTSHLDKARSEDLIQGLTNFTAHPPAARGSTVIIATHDPRLVAVADVVLTIQDRRLVSMAADAYRAKVHDLREQRPKVAASPLYISTQEG